MSPHKIRARTRKGKSISQSRNICAVSNITATAQHWATRSPPRTNRTFERRSASFRASRPGNGWLLGNVFGLKWGATTGE